MTYPSPMTQMIYATRIRCTRFLLSACIALVAACSGESPTGTDGNKPVPKPVPDPTPIGAMMVTVAGVTNGLADISVSGPSGYSRAITSTGALSNLAAGRYVLTARTVVAAGRSYVPMAATQDIDIGSDGVPVAVTVTYRMESVAIVVSVTGLSGGTTARMTLTPPVGAPIAVTGDLVLDSVAPGRWRLDAEPVSHNGHTYRPHPASYDFNVDANAIGRMPIDYALSTGGIAVAVSGLPASAAGNVNITGPGGFARSVTATETVTELAPGAYVVTASPVVFGGITYIPTPATRSVTVIASLVAQPALVTYAAAAGRLNITTSGLAGGVTPTFVLTGDGGSRGISGAGTTDSIAPGTYSLTANTLMSGGTTYTPTPASRTIVIVSAGTTNTSFAYTSSETPSSLALSISGLGSDDGDVLLSGPAGYTRTLTSSAALSELTPGLYTVTVRNVRTALGSYGAATPVRTLTLTAGAGTTHNVVYTPLPAVVQLVVAGVPFGASPSVSVTPPAGASFWLASSSTVSPAIVGRWRLAAASIVFGGNTYTPTPSSYDETVLAGDTLRFTVTYSSSAPVLGNLNVSINGLPGGVSGSVSVSGPSGYTQVLTASSTLSNLTPGTYTVAASSFTNSGTTYSPTPGSQSVSVSAGATAAASVTYTSGSSGGPVNLSIENVYVTQAVQTWDGDASLVAGRNALVRVFVRAASANSLQPDVRVRVYEGASLIQTATITAPSGSVPTSISEGSLNASWNVQIAGGNVRAGMRVLVDLDPTNAIGETNRVDNVWPTDGTPASITTNAVPALAVKFVPIVLAGLTGNVTDGNREQFLNLARLVMPLQSVTSSVRAAYTSNAPALQSGNDNNAWSTVLSEINALRSADGAANNMHYYGVVKTSYSSGVAGIAYVPGRAAVGWDHMPSGDRVAAHELGHNFSRPHTPCGVGGDAAYPYAGGVIGAYGWNSSTNALVSPTLTDVMGYCSNQWISDWTWNKVMTYRSSSGMEVAASTVGDGLLIWGRVTDGRVLLEPAFRVRARPSPRAAKSNYRVVISATDGATLTDVPIDVNQVDHVVDHDERQFAVVVPWSEALEKRVARLAVIDVRSPFPAAVRASAVAAGSTIAPDANSPTEMPDPAVVVTTAGANRSSVAWDRARYPMAMVRDPATGEILSFLRGSGNAFTDRGQAVEIVFSDGVRSSTKKVVRTR